MNRRTRLARKTALEARVPLRGKPQVSARRAAGMADGARKIAATETAVAACSMCREPLEPGERWYCAACREVRELVLERDGYRCVCCGTDIRYRHYSLGHRLRAGQGGRAVPPNLIVVWGLGGEAHHGRIDLYRDPADAAKGYRLKSGQDPLEIPVTYVLPDGSQADFYLWDDGTRRDCPQTEAGAA